MKANLILKKLMGMLITIIIVTLLTFVGFELIKSDAAINLLGTESTQSQIDELRHRLGLDQPMIIRYIKYISNALKGNFGESFIYKEPVIDLISDKFVITGIMSLMALIFIILSSFIVSFICILSKHGIIEKIIVVVNQIIMSVPSFFAGLVIIFIFGFIFRWFAPGSFVSYKDNHMAFFKYMIFPAIAIALPKCAMMVKLLLNSINSEYNNFYVKTAISRGNSDFRVLISHVLKNAMLPIITFLGMLLNDMMAFSIVVEQVFGVPGIGRLLIVSISNRDYPVVQTIILFIAIIVVVVNLLVDIIYSILDPRISVK